MSSLACLPAGRPAATCSGCSCLHAVKSLPTMHGRVGSWVIKHCSIGSPACQPACRDLEATQLAAGEQQRALPGAAAGFETPLKGGKPAAAGQPSAAAARKPGEQSVHSSTKRRGIVWRPHLPWLKVAILLALLAGGCCSLGAAPCCAVLCCSGNDSVPPTLPVPHCPPAAVAALPHAPAQLPPSLRCYLCLQAWWAATS